MISVNPCQHPENALLKKYADQGAYTDCYKVEISGTVTLQQYVVAFYTTKIFKLERLILKWLVSKPSSDAQARDVANGTVEQFAAWRVEGRCDNQLLMCDFQSRTRSWFMVDCVETGEGSKTSLYFGSAVVYAQKRGKKPLTGNSFRLLLAFHKVYSKILLNLAKSGLDREFRNIR